MKKSIKKNGGSCHDVGCRFNHDGKCAVAE